MKRDEANQVTVTNMSKLGHGRLWEVIMDKEPKDLDYLKGIFNALEADTKAESNGRKVVNLISEADKDAIAAILSKYAA